jgi:OmpA-OmpF porin, OOP family
MHLRVLFGLSLALLLAAPGVARAQEGGNIELQTFRPAMDTKGFVTVNGSQVLINKQLSFGLVTNWGRGLLRFERDTGSPDGPDVYEVRNMLSPTLVAAVGLWVGPLELELGGSLPFGVMAGDRNPNFEPPGQPNLNQNFNFEGQGIGNAGVHLKWRLLHHARGPRVGLALIGSAYLPTASGNREAWLGDDSISPQLMVVVDREMGPFRAGINAGYRHRTGTNEFTDMGAGDPNSPMTLGTISVGSTIPFGGALSLAVVPQKFDAVAELIGEIPLQGENYFPLEALAGIKVYLARNSFLTLGGGAGLLPGRGANPDFRAFLGIVFEPRVGDRDGDGIPDDIDQCPDEPEDFDGFEDEDGCPDPDNDQDGIPDHLDHCPNEPGPPENHGCPLDEIADRDGDGIPDHLDLCPDDPEDFDGFEDEDGCPDPDNDGDGIPDIDDLCPNEPEDFDGFEDEDGCPDPDNDKDGILDDDDMCPNEPETWNGFEDEDGCPDRGRVVVTDTKIEILDKIYFEFDSDVIKSESFPILDAIVATLNGNPDIRLVEIQGHTDQRGSDAYNLDLSDRRAASVRRYLIEGGIDSGRLQSQGYGKRQLIDQRNNEEAWAKNRRVEFLIIKRSN